MPRSSASVQIRRRPGPSLGLHLRRRRVRNHRPARRRSRASRSCRTARPRPPDGLPVRARRRSTRPRSDGEDVRTEPRTTGQRNGARSASSPTRSTYRGPASRPTVQIVQDRIDRAADARRDAPRAARRRRWSSCSSRSAFGTVYARRALVPIRESLADQRGGPAPPARVRGRRQPRAADAADRHPQQRRAPRPPSASEPVARSGRRSTTSTTRSAT